MQAPRDNADGAIRCVIGSYDGFRFFCDGWVRGDSNYVHRIYKEQQQVRLAPFNA
jgi:hypothetical protein